MFCNKYKVILFDSFLCEECEDNPKVSTGYYNECKVTSADGKYAIDYYVISKDKWEGDIAWVFTRNDPYCSIYSSSI